MSSTSGNRRKRVGISNQKRRLYVDETQLNLKEYRYYWAVDKDGMIQDLKERGYEDVPAEDVGAIGDEDSSRSTPLDSVAEAYAGRDVNNIPYNQRLMRIPIKYYEQDLADKEAINAQIDTALQGSQGIENQYGNVDLNRRKQ